MSVIYSIGIIFFSFNHILKDSKMIRVKMENRIRNMKFENLVKFQETQCY